MRMVYYRGLEFVLLPGVYEPSDDTYLLADNLRVSHGQSVLELGTGCGMIAVLAALMGGRVTATDISERAIECARMNAARHGVEIELLLGSLFEPVWGRKFDVVVFNPPYLPSLGMSDDPVLQACEAGPDGRSLIDPFIDELPNHLKPGGEVYLVQSSLSGAERTEERLRGAGFELEIVKKKLWFEHLLLFKVKRVNNLGLG